MNSGMSLILLLSFGASMITVAEGIICYSCQYSDNPTRVGYECVTSPADYNLGPTTVDCGDTGECSSETQILSGTNTIYFMTRGCKTKTDGCTSGSVDICVESCSNADLCNDKNYDPAPTASPASTLPPTTTTEVPGTISCYSCVYSYNPDVSDACVTDPPNAPLPNEVRCPPPRVCTTFRQWDKGLNLVRSFTRGCEEQQGQTDYCMEDAYFITCFTWCNTDYCNSGDGTVPPSVRKYPKPRGIARKRSVVET